MASHEAAGKSKSFNVILCPSHMTEKWVREIGETIPNVSAGIIRSINSLKKFYHAFEKSKGGGHFFAVMSKEKARDGYMRRPAVHYNRRLNAFICPSCGKVIEQDLTEDGVKYRIPAISSFFRKENEQNHFCPECRSLLWAPLLDGAQSEWVKVPDWGFVHRQDPLRGMTGCKSLKAKEMLEQIDLDRNGIYPSSGAHRRFPISTYISKKLKGKIDGFIADELQQYNNDSGQGDAMAEILRASDKFVGMTATLINGYASGIFNLLYRLVPALMLRDGKQYKDYQRFCVEYGVMETTYETESNYAANRRTIPRKQRERMLPGVSPLVYSRFLLENAVFLSLADMGKELPEYEEFPVPVSMSAVVENEYRSLEVQFRSVMRENRRIAQRVMSAFMGLLTVYPDQPYGHAPIVNPLEPTQAVAKARDRSKPGELLDKDRKVLELVKRKTADGERVLIYTSWVRIDTQEKLLKLFTDNGIRAAVLSAKVSPNKREVWLDKQVRDGVQVVVCNPSIVETGLDLNAFTTLIYFNISYNLFTLRQSSRRSWRINQTAPRIEVYFFYYKGTMQHRAIELMASKLAVASIIEGNMSDEGLAAMSDCRDLTSQLAAELAKGIRCEVTDLSETFSKMAVRHKAGEPEARRVRMVESSVRAAAAAVPERETVTARAAEQPGESPVHAPDSQDMEFVFASPKRSSRKAAVTVDVVDGQVSLFGIPA